MNPMLSLHISNRVLPLHNSVGACESEGAGDKCSDGGQLRNLNFWSSRRMRQLDSNTHARLAAARNTTTRTLVHASIDLTYTRNTFIKPRAL